MAFRARLAAPPPSAPQVWPWHTLQRTTINARIVASGDRRMEAETYLASGFGVRGSIEKYPAGWVSFDRFARAWAPPRIKQIFVAPEYGVPYLNTSQVFDIRPSPRKWLAAEKTSQAQLRLARQGTILVMASATPGRTTVVTHAHEGAFISHHFMRVEPHDDSLTGWIYAFLLSSQGQAMMTGSQYASIIRHIEPHHLGALPVPVVGKDIAALFGRRLREVLELRNRSFQLTQEADATFADAVGTIEPREPEEGFVVNVSDVSNRRRRLEAGYHTPRAGAILHRFPRWESLREVTERVWWMPRFKRFYGDGGISYLSADELFTVNPFNQKKILVDPADNHRDYFVQAGWIVMACSGQVYGLNGAATLIVEEHENIFFSHDLIRIVPNTQKIRAGYLVVALTHRTHGRPLLIRAAYGTSIPHLDPGDVADFPVVRLPEAEEKRIADLAEAAARARAQADVVERRIRDDASAIIADFIAHGAITTAAEGLARDYAIYHDGDRDGVGNTT